MADWFRGCKQQAAELAKVKSIQAQIFSKSPS